MHAPRRRAQGDGQEAVAVHGGVDDVDESVDEGGGVTPCPELIRDPLTGLDVGHGQTSSYHLLGLAIVLPAAVVVHSHQAQVRRRHLSDDALLDEIEQHPTAHLDESTLDLIRVHQVQPPDLLQHEDFPAESAGQHPLQVGDGLDLPVLRLQQAVTGVHGQSALAELDDDLLSIRCGRL